MTRLLVVRHGQSEWNAVGRWQGWADPPLSDLGRRQSQAAATAVGDVDTVVASDLRRAHATATIIAGALGDRGVGVDDGLRERDVGEWTGLTRAEIEARWADSAELLGPPARPPGGEALDRFDARTHAALIRVAAALPDERVLVVAHGGVVRSVERRLRLEPGPLANLGGIEVDVEGDRLTFVRCVLLLDATSVAVTTPTPP